jgi:hypothetical protein
MRIVSPETLVTSLRRDCTSILSSSISVEDILRVCEKHHLISILHALTDKKCVYSQNVMLESEMPHYSPTRNTFQQT